MVAREMFERLGYRRYKTGVSILYINDSDDEYKSVEFYYSDFTFKADDDYHDPVRIDLALFDAIQTQMRELGWI